jgi:hypothetical protein
MKQNCFRCDKELSRPLEKSAEYVRGDDMVEIEDEMAHIGYKLTDMGKVRADALDVLLPNRSWGEIASRITLPNAEDFIDVPNSMDGSFSEKDIGDGNVQMTADIVEHPFSTDAYTEVEVSGPETVKEDNDIVRVESHSRKTERQKTGLVCLDCVDEDDKLLWE